MSARQRPRWVPLLECSAILICVALWLLVAVRAWSSFQFAPQSISALGAGLLGGFLLADFATGLVHWFCDTFFEENTPVIGALLIAPFREHHRDPLAMTHHGFLELTGNSCLALAPVVGAALWLGPTGSNAMPAAFYAFVLALTAAAGCTNLFHRWAHDGEAPRFARVLQNAGLILAPGHHAQHHAPPHASAYCVTNGWMNALLDRIDFFTHAKRVLVACGLPSSSS